MAEPNSTAPDLDSTLHCILTAGALSEDATQWRRPKQQRYLFPEAALGALFRGKFMAGLRALAQELRWPGVSALQSIARPL